LAASRERPKWPDFVEHLGDGAVDPDVEFWDESSAISGTSEF
jgi:hypothetical protein